VQSVTVPKTGFYSSDETISDSKAWAMNMKQLNLSKPPDQRDFQYSDEVSTVKPVTAGQQFRVDDRNNNWPSVEVVAIRDEPSDVQSLVRPCHEEETTHNRNDHSEPSSRRTQSPFSSSPREGTLLLSRLLSIHKPPEPRHDGNVGKDALPALQEGSDRSVSPLEELESATLSDDTLTEFSFSSTSTDQELSVVNLTDLDQPGTRKLLAERLVRYFGSLQARQWFKNPAASTGVRQNAADGCEPDEPYGSTSGPIRTERPEGSVRRNQKRHRGGDDEEGDSDGDDDAGRRRKRPKGKEKDCSGNTGASRRRFACPYYKRNPRKYCKQKHCPGPGWEELSRLKYVNSNSSLERILTRRQIRPSGQISLQASLSTLR
jgi:hypothetical protein